MPESAKSYTGIQPKSVIRSENPRDTSAQLVSSSKAVQNSRKQKFKNTQIPPPAEQSRQGPCKIPATADNPMMGNEVDGPQNLIEAVAALAQAKTTMRRWITGEKKGGQKIQDLSIKEKTNQISMQVERDGAREETIWLHHELSPTIGKQFNNQKGRTTEGKGKSPINMGLKSGFLASNVQSSAASSNIGPINESEKKQRNKPKDWEGTNRRRNHSGAYNTRSN